MDEVLYVSTKARSAEYRSQLLDALELLKWQLLPNMRLIEAPDSISGLYNIITYQEYVELLGLALEYRFRTPSKRWYILFNDSHELDRALGELNRTREYKCDRFDKPGGYEVTSRGDRRFSPFFMKVKNPETNELMTLEDYYHLFLKGYWYEGMTSWKDAKSLPPLPSKITSFEFETLSTYRSYLSLHNGLLYELAVLGQQYVFTDMFMVGNNSQAQIYCSILNTLFNGRTCNEIIN